MISKKKQTILIILIIVIISTFYNMILAFKILSECQNLKNKIFEIENFIEKPILQENFNKYISD